MRMQDHQLSFDEDLGEGEAFNESGVVRHWQVFSDAGLAERLERYLIQSVEHVVFPEELAHHAINDIHCIAPREAKHWW